MVAVTKQEQAMILMVALDEGFRSTTYEDLAAMEHLLNGEIPGGVRDYWKGLRHRPLTWWKPLLHFITGGEREHHLPSVAEELKIEGGTLFLRDVLKWALDINLMHARFFGGHHPHEPENVKVDPSPVYWNWRFSKGGFLMGLYQAFRNAPEAEIRALQDLLRRTESHHAKTGDSLGDGLADMPFWFYRLLAYFRARGGGRFTLAEVEQQVMVQGPGNKGFMHHEHIRGFLSWTHKKGVLDMAFERPAPGAEDREATFSVDTTPLIERWTL